jgi:hypothetical protein
VIVNAIEEWVRGSIRQKQQAEYFLFQDEDDFPFVCSYAGLDPESVRQNLWIIRAQAATGRNTSAA